MTYRRGVTWLLAGVSAGLFGCATPPQQAVNWNFPDTPPKEAAAVMRRPLPIESPPYPRPSYADYNEEPTRFFFHPRPPVQLDEETGEEDMSVMEDFGAEE